MRFRLEPVILQSFCCGFFWRFPLAAYWQESGFMGERKSHSI